MGPIHKQLIGTWKSDKKRTLETYKAYSHFPLAKKRQFGSIFGKLELKDTAKFCYVTLDGQTTRDRYDVIAEDEDSIVLRTYSDEFKKKVNPEILEDIEELFNPKLQHLHFETYRNKTYYWIGIRVLIEWFQKSIQQLSPANR